MKSHIIEALAVISAVAVLGCEPDATDAQLDTMCQNQLELQGVMRGTSEDEEAAKVEEDFRVKEEGLLNKMASDLKGQEELLAQNKKEIEAGTMLLPEPKADTETAKDSEKTKEAKTPEQTKLELTKLVEDQATEAKKGITDQFEGLMKTLGPQRRSAIERARSQAKKNKQEADEALKACIIAAKKKRVKEKMAICRSGAQTKNDYAACETK